MGHEVTKLPMYLPLFSDEHDLNAIPVFYGAVSLYLKQVYPFFRNAPSWFDKLLNSKPVLKLAARNAGSTRAKGLEDMTVSMLLGEEGTQKDELEKMVDWIANDCKPDIIHLSNALLLGLAHRIKEKLNVPVICSLQDEDVWVDVMSESFRKRIWELMHQKAEYVDSFIAVSDFYKSAMIKKMELPAEKISSIHIGVDYEDYHFEPERSKGRNIGFISRMCYENGLDILTDAFTILKENEDFDDVKLILTGGYTGDDIKYLKEIKQKLKSKGLLSHVEFHEDFEENGKKDFFDKVSIISVPVRNGEAFGMYLLETMASGVPVVQPELGAFPEIIKLSGGGITYSHNTPSGLAEALSGLLQNKELLKTLGQEARKGIEDHFNIHKQASDMIDVYKKVISGQWSVNLINKVLINQQL
jgi:glycosyltransferase involved in cell wall biosynthesis